MLSLFIYSGYEGSDHCKNKNKKITPSIYDTYMYQQHRAIFGLQAVA